ncbi:M48 family metalloprotease [Amylibacter sp. IMCC11727]|uniref:M48 family metalloprotease n=1 Tax=Amylibacter sp. IMCC11727 TaxID=3039851 RepID=UPI00244D9CE2|nr:M48 family metalloprotease [Amylibacter sp. IMCC11727]WGI21023.1 M48 family metalloprotease [Amylibacter sp. IMCC11727]
MRILITLACIGLMAACTPTTEQPSKSRPGFTAVRSADAGLAAYSRVSKRMEPLTEQICRSIHSAKPRSFCDFQVRVINDPKQPPNAFQSIGKDGRPIIAFNINILRSFNNDDELAFVFAHEAGHQIAQHIEKSQANALAGAVLGGLIVAAGGGDAQIGIDLGGSIGGRSYSKKFELQADTIAAHITDRSGYNAKLGAKVYERTGGSSALLATHPPSSERIARVQSTIRTIDAAKANGRRAAITW